jgi:hypothetical protein
MMYRSSTALFARSTSTCLIAARSSSRMVALHRYSQPCVSWCIQVCGFGWSYSLEQQENVRQMFRLVSTYSAPVLMRPLLAVNTEHAICCLTAKCATQVLEFPGTCTLKEATANVFCRAGARAYTHTCAYIYWSDVRTGNVCTHSQSYMRSE